MTITTQDQKCFVVDTNVLLSDPKAIYGFGENVIVIPMAVLEELDNIKMRKSDLSHDARFAIREINNVLKGCKDAVAGAEFNAGSTLSIMPDSCYEGVDGIVEVLGLNDNKILNTAIAAHKSDVYREVVLVSNDINMRLKGQGAGLPFVQEHENSCVIADVDLLPKGYLEMTDDWLGSIPTDKITRKSCGKTNIDLEYMPEGVTVNTWLFDEGETWVAVVRGFDLEANVAQLEFKNRDAMFKRRCSSITPRNVQQAIAIDAIMNPDIDLVIMDGAAGSGKTLLAMAGATEMVIGKKSSYRMEEIIFTRTMDTQFEQIGFLKGGEEEKMLPWLAAVTDNMEVISRSAKNPKLMPKESVEGEDSFIRTKNLGFMRGRSLNHRVLVLDEAQNLTGQQMKTIITRAGEFCKVIVLGNLAQIDNEHVSDRSSGLTYLTEKFSGCEFAQTLCLEGVVRSRLAEFAEQNM